MALERRTCEESVLTRSGSASACWMRTPLMPSSSRCASNSLGGHDDRQPGVARVDRAAVVERAPDDVDADERSAPDHLQVAGELVGDGVQRDVVLDRAALDVDLVHGARPSCGVTHGSGVTTATHLGSKSREAVPDRHRYDGPPCQPNSKTPPPHSSGSGVRTCGRWCLLRSSTCTRTSARTRPTARASISPGCSRPWTPEASLAPARSRSSLRPERATRPPTPKCWRRPRRAMDASWRSAAASRASGSCPS